MLVFLCRRECENLVVLFSKAGLTFPCAVLFLLFLVNTYIVMMKLSFAVASKIKHLFLLPIKVSLCFHYRCLSGQRKMGSTGADKVPRDTETEGSETTIEIKIKTLDSQTYTLRVDKQVNY